MDVRITGHARTVGLGLPAALALASVLGAAQGCGGGSGSSGGGAVVPPPAPANAAPSVGWSLVPLPSSVGGIQHIDLVSGASGVIYLSASNGLFRSNDDGANWTMVRSGPHDYTLPTGLQVAYTANGPLHKTADGGSSWTTVFTSVSPSSVGAAAVHSGTGAIYLSGNQSGSPAFVWKSTNAGQSWTPLGATLQGVSNPGTPRLSAIATDPTNASTIYISPRDGGRGLFKSIDGGVTWLNLNATVPKNPDGAPNSSTPLTFAIDLIVDPGASNVIFAVMRNTVVPLGNTSFHGVIRSNDGGQNWSFKNSGLTANLQSVAGLPNDMKVNALAINHARTFVLFATTTDGVFKTVNSGDSWVQVSTGLPEAETNALAIDPNDTSVIYTSQGAKLYRSRTEGGPVGGQTPAAPKPSSPTNKPVNGVTYYDYRLLFSEVPATTKKYRSLSITGVTSTPSFPTTDGKRVDYHNEPDARFGQTFPYAADPFLPGSYSYVVRDTLNNVVYAGNFTLPLQTTTQFIDTTLEFNIVLR